MSWKRCGSPAATKTSEPGTTGRVSTADRHQRAAGDDVVELILGMGRLRIGRTRVEDVDPGRQVRDPQELVIQAATRRTVGLDVVVLPGVHVAPPGRGDGRASGAPPPGRVPARDGRHGPRFVDPG